MVEELSTVHYFLTDSITYECGEHQDAHAWIIDNSSYYPDSNETPRSPKLLNITNSIINEMTSFFKLDNLFTCIQRDENKKPHKNISISKIIMDNVIDKKLGTITYYYGNKKSSKAYHTYDYPEIYYNKKLYNNTTQWLKSEFYKKI